MRQSTGEKVFNAFNVLLLTGLMLITLYPFLYVVFASVSDAGLLIRHRGLLLKPAGFDLQAYRMVFRNPILFSSYMNTLIYVVSGTSLSVFLTICGAYSLSRKNVLFRMPITFFFVFTMWFSGGMIPLFLLVRNLGLLNNRLALILPGAVSTYNLIITITYFKSIPDSLEESARIDGATNMTILLRIILPLSTAIVAIMVLFYAVAHWNSWFNAMIYLRTRTKYPLQLVLREVLIVNMTDAMSAGESSSERQALGEVIKYALIIVATVPILLIYPFLQKYFVKGVMVGAIKE